MNRILLRSKKDVRYVKREEEDHWFSRSATCRKMLEEMRRRVDKILGICPVMGDITRAIGSRTTAPHDANKFVPPKAVQ